MIVTKDKSLIVPKTTSGNQLLFKKHDVPIAPVEISDEVEKYARENGRRSRFGWIPFWNCWVARFSRVTNDPMLGAVQAGRLPEEEKWELVPLQRWDHEKKKYTSLDIEQMGPSGVRNFLEKGNTWSGRGEFRSLEDGVKQAKESRIAVQEKLERDTRANARYRALDIRRQLMKIPFLRVGIDIKESNG